MNVMLDGNLAVDGQVGSSITFIANVSFFLVKHSYTAHITRPSFMKNNI